MTKKGGNTIGNQGKKRREGVKFRFEGDFSSRATEGGALPLAF